jgi:hypothetical protein
MTEDSPQEQGLSMPPPPADLHEEIAASTAESRRNTRRVMDALKQVGEMLTAMSQTLSSLHEKARQQPQLSPPATDGCPIAALIDLADRIDRISAAFERAPSVRKPWWPPARRAIEILQEDRRMLQDSFAILSSHVARMLAEAGAEKIPSLGRLFDPSCMNAIEVVPDPSQPDHTVIAELLPGWRQRSNNTILRPCHVRVSRARTN